MSKEFVKISLKKSVIGRLPKHRAILASLGLKKINSSVVFEKTSPILGMINKINYLIKVECVK